MAGIGRGRDKDKEGRGWARSAATKMLPLPLASSGPCSRAMRRRGYTLIEVLAVVAILGLVAVAVSPSLARALVTDPVARAARLVRDADRAARQQAAGGGAVLVIRDGRLLTTVANEVISTLTLPNTVSVAWSTDSGAPVESLSLDRGGRSIDVFIDIRSPTLTKRFHILGLTGAWLALEPGGQP